MQGIYLYCTVKYLLATTAQYVQECMCITLQSDKNWSLLYCMCTCAEIMSVLHKKWSAVYYMCSLVQMQTWVLHSAVKSILVNTVHHLYLCRNNVCPAHERVNSILHVQSCAQCSHVQSCAQCSQIESASIVSDNDLRWCDTKHFEHPYNVLITCHTDCGSNMQHMIIFNMQRSS